MPQIVFQVSSDQNFLTKLADPAFWKQYKLFALREITEKAAEVIRQHASKIWKNPTGALDQSWFTRIEQDKELGFIWNSKPYAYWQNVGVRPHRMTYLLNSRSGYSLSVPLHDSSGKKLADSTRVAVIPLTVDGNKMFRMATARHMMLPDAVKPWWHPGLPAKHYLEEGMDEYRRNHLVADYQGLIIKVLDVP